jgi:hypothetical protein
MTMSGDDVLLTIVELAVAFAGFSGVVAVFGQRAAGRHVDMPQVIQNRIYAAYL